MKQNSDLDPESILPLSPVMYHMLISLADQELHGYGIKLEVEERTGGEMSLDPGTIYGYIKKMLKLGLIYEADQRPDEDNERRRYYRLSDFGSRVVAAHYDALKCNS